MTQRDAYRLKHRLDLGKPSPGKPQSAQQSQTQVFSPAGHSVVYQGTASPGLSDTSIGKHLFVSFLLFAGPTWAVVARAPPLPFGLGIKVS